MSERLVPPPRKPAEVPAAQASEQTSWRRPAAGSVASEAPAVLAGAVPVDEDHGAGRRAVVGQITLGLLAALAACLVAVAWNFFPAHSVPGMLFRPVQDGYVPMLPLLMVQLLWVGAVMASVVQAVRIGRLARWARIDAEAAPVPVWVAQVSRASILGLVSISAVLLAWSWLF